MDENTVLLTAGGSKSSGAFVTAGALTEQDSRCYWKCSVVSTSYNRLYNLNTGITNGNIMVKNVTGGVSATQGAYKIATGGWLAVASGNTMTVRGQSVSTYFLKAYSDNDLYLTVPEDNGPLYLSMELDDTTPQEFYFEASTYVNLKLATPTKLTAQDGTNFIISSSGAANAVYPQWNCSSTAVVYEMRSRTRRYDMDGVAADWGDWTDWTMTSAAKQSAGIMRSATSVSAPAVDNSTYSQADIQIEVRLTSAKTTGAYNKTGTVTHGPSCSGLIQKWKVPTVTISAPTCTRDGLKLSYNSDFTIAGNTIRIVSIVDGAAELVSNYILTNQDYTGDILIDWDAMSAIPAENDTLDITFQLIENNGIVSVTVQDSLSVAYDSEVGFSFTPTYSVSNRMSIEAALPAYDSIQCYMRRTDIAGNEVWVACEEIADDNGRTFEICPAFGSAPTVMWVVSHTTLGNTQWGYKVETLSITLSTLSYVWNWVDDAKVPHAFIMKYRAGGVVQPGDSVTLPANKFTTTGREYPIFRYTKTVDRVLDIGGAILNRETDPNATKADAELMATANHTVYRQPNGKWYQAAVKGVSFTREMSYYNIQVTQEAETR